jgi:hypothetical protein
MRPKYPKKRKKYSLCNKQADITTGDDQWIGTNAKHCIDSIDPKNAEEADALTKIYQDKIRHSPIWDEFLKIYGPEKAEQALKECRAVLKSSYG